MDSAFLNLVRGNRLINHMGLKMDEGVPYRYAHDYTYVEIPLRNLVNPTDNETSDKASRNQRLRIEAACSLAVAGSHKVLVKVNPHLHEYAEAPSLLLLDSRSGEQPHFYATFRKDMEASKLEWAVRLYLMA